MQEQNENNYVSYENVQNYGVYQSAPNYDKRQQNTESRNPELCFGFGIASLGMILGNQFIGLLFGILSLVFYRLAAKQGLHNGSAKSGRIMGLIGIIFNGIFVGFIVLYVLFVILSLFVSIAVKF